MTDPQSAVEVNPAERLPKWLRRSVDCGLSADDDPRTRLRKRMLLLIVYFATAVITVTVLSTLAFGDPRSAIAPAIYGLGSVVGVVHLIRTKRSGVLLYSQLLMVLLLPALQQWLLGGFVASAGAVLYSMNAALLAVVLVGPRAARWWFVAFAVVVAVSGAADGWLTRAVKPTDVPLALFFVVTITVVGLLAWLPLAFFVEARRRLVAELDAKNLELDRERQRSEALLLNILPAQIARRLKAGERPIADRHALVAVLFADIVGFTPASQAVDPSEVIRFLNKLFTRFDRLAATLGLEKVKTIGDAYMVVGGAPTDRPDAVARIAQMARQMIDVAGELTFGGSRLQLRIGIDAGPAVAGVIGESKFAWDLYGDVVNTASRMESHGIPGQVQLTERAWRMLPDGLAAHERGVIDVKGKGAMRTYLLDLAEHAARTPTTL
jgi:adenylate cyclase